MIPRQDFEAGEQSAAALNQNVVIKADELEFTKPTYNILRKPDFQRETAIWTPEKVRDLVCSFLGEHLVPSLILWKSEANNYFVIDGAHRLSSLIAWVQDDYGDGPISKAMFKDISKTQKEVARQTRALIEDRVGKYKDVSESFQRQNSPAEVRALATKLPGCVFNVQWVGGDAARAEQSFFKINQQGTPINATELFLLESRKRPNAIAARAIVRGGTGHQYWKNFPVNTKADIEQRARAVNEALFEPPLESNVIKTLGNL